VTDRRTPEQGQAYTWRRRPTPAWLPLRPARGPRPAGRTGAVGTLVAAALLSLCGWIWMSETRALADGRPAPATVVAVHESLLDRPHHVVVRFRTAEGAEAEVGVTRYAWRARPGDSVQIEYATWDGELVAQQAGYPPGFAARGGLLAAGGLLALSGGAGLAWSYRRPSRPADPGPVGRIPAPGPPPVTWSHRTGQARPPHR
jgi:hypothetical protein